VKIPKKGQPLPARQPKMYKIKPIVEVWPDLDLPTTMYNVKSVVSLQLEEASVHPNITIELSEIDQLAARQEKVLLQLQEYKRTIELLKKKVGDQEKQIKANPQAAAVKPLPQKVSMKPINQDNLHELVVNVNPSRIPYCILGLKKLWAERLALHVDFYTHSTVLKLTDEVMNFVNKVKSLETGASTPKLNLTVIWKDVNGLQLITSPTSYSPLQAEVNFLRFLFRIGPNEHNYEELEDSTEIDSIFDSCYLLSSAANVKDRMTQLRILNTKLGKQKYFGGNSISIVDVTVSSAIKQLNITKDLTPALKAWLERVSKELNY